MKKLFEIANLRCSYDRNYKEGESKVVLEIHDLTLPVGKKIFIVGESGIGKSTILEVLGLMNNTIVPQSDTWTHIRLSGRGWGHGVGLCQIGAAVMASRGHTYEDILAHYYPGSILGSVNP